LDARLIPGTTGAAYPVVSADGESVGYVEGFVLWRTAIDGGTPAVVSRALGGTGLIGASWGRDDTILCALPEGILRVPADGGAPELVIAAKQGESIGTPHLLPDGESVLFSVSTATGAQRWDEAQIVVQSLRTGERTVVMQGGSDARLVPTGHLVYAVGSDLFAVAFDLRRLEVRGRPVPVVRGVQRAVVLGLLGGDTANYGVADNVTLVYLRGAGTVSGGTRLASVMPGGERDVIDLPASQYAHPRLSPDSRWLAVERQDAAGVDIWLYETSGVTSLRRLTEGGSNRDPVWSSDGDYIAFQSSREGDAGIFWRRADGTGSVERLTRPEVEAVHIPEDWSPRDGRLAFTVMKGGQAELWFWAQADGSTERFGELESQGPLNAVFFPNGQWIAYTERRGNGARIYVDSVSSPGTRYQLGQDGNHHPLWTPDGTQLIYYFQNGAVEAVNVLTALTVGFARPTALAGFSPFNVSPSSSLNHDVATDGRFVSVVAESESTGSSVGSVVVVENWDQELKRLIPTH
jgi:Tol biopolymer transport system component